MSAQVVQWMDKVPWYNTTIFTKLNGQIFKDYFITGRKYRYELMCAFDAYEKLHLSIGQTINFIENLLQFFEVNYEKIIMISNIKMSDLFKTVPNHFLQNPLIIIK